MCDSSHSFFWYDVDHLPFFSGSKGLINQLTSIINQLTLIKQGCLRFECRIPDSLLKGPATTTTKTNRERRRDVMAATIKGDKHKSLKINCVTCTGWILIL